MAIDLNTVELHPAIASEALTDALDRLATAEQTARADVARVVAATDELERADASGDPAARWRAAEKLSAAHRLVERSSPAQLDADGLRVVRLATSDALRYISDRTEFAPVSDPRDKPQRFKPTDLERGEAQSRLRQTLAILGQRVDAWYRDPPSLDHAGLDDLLAALSGACDAADALRALVSVATN
jgi:hypothetical protein